LSGCLAGFEWCAADQPTVAIEQNDLDGDVAPGNDRLGGIPRRACNFVAERNTFALRDRKRFGGIVGRQDARAKACRASRGLGKLRKQRVVDNAALGMDSP
jgi:hypothetical protein